MSRGAWSSCRLLHGVRPATPAPPQTSSGSRTSGFDWITSRFWKTSVSTCGEMPRVLIAWAVLDRPNVLLFDEPTATVDIGSEDMLYESLNRLEKDTNITVFLITHDIHIASRYSDAVLALNRTVRFFGAPSRLSEPDLLMEIFGSGSGLAEHKHDFGARGFR